MAMLMGAVVLAVLLLGTAALAGHPLLFLGVAVLLAAAVLVLARRFAVWRR
jgi:hypothetical protein